MKNEDLRKLKKHISEFSSEELKKRDKYLRGLVTGEIQGPLVGYPSIDKPQLKQYDFEKYLQDNRKETVTEALYRQNEDNLDGIALDYFYGKITYRKFMSNIGDLVKSLYNYGIRRGDYVAVCMPGMPESMCSIYALGYLGAVGIYLPPYLDKDTMINDLNKKNTTLLFVMDLFYDKFKDVFDEVIKSTNISKVIVVPTLNSSPLGKLKRTTKMEGIFENYNDFIAEGKDTPLPNMVEYEPQMPLSVVYSSGSTGTLKGILLSHDTFNNSATSYRSFGFNLSKGQIVYQAIPLWSSTGQIADGTTALYYGCTLMQNPKFDPLVYSKNLGLYRINWGVATTELFGGLDDLKKQKLFQLMLKLKIVDYSHLENIYIGGTLSTQKNKERLNSILESVGCKSQAKRSYGTCENGSIVTAELNGINHPDNSVGLPIPGVTVMAIDEKGSELPYGERGELAVKTDCGMIDYFNRPDLSKNIFFKDADVSLFKHTGDVGYILPSGDVIYEGRGSDYSVVDGLKIYNFDIKNAILSDEHVYDAEVFINPNGKLCAHVVFYENPEDGLLARFQDLQARIFNIFKDIRYVPEYFKVRSSFPMASSTKRDFKTLKAETDDFVYVPNKYLTKQFTLK